MIISSLFGKTKPVNYVLLLSLLFVFFALAHLGFSGMTFDQVGFLKGLWSLGCLLFSVFIVNFIVQRNHFTAQNSFAILFYALFILLFPDSMLDPEVIFATFFLLLAHRRLVSLKSLRNPKGKIFDGALWILVASLFLNQLIFLLLLVWFYVYFYAPNQLNYWLVPLASAMVVALTGWSFSYLLGDPEFLFRHFSVLLKEVNLVRFSDGTWIKPAIFLFVVLISGVLSFIRHGKSGQGKLTQLRLLILGWFLVMLILAFHRGFLPTMGCEISGIFAKNYRHVQ
ncbi:MAG: hypothetical protein P8Z38_13200 [Robiginitalea sp.]